LTTCIYKQWWGLQVTHKGETNMQPSNWGDKFSHIAMKDLARFLSTYNMVTQTLAVDGTNVYNIQSGGGGDCTINGVYIAALAADAELLHATEGAAPSAAWAANTSYSADDTVYTGTLTNVNQMFWKCLKAHKSMHGLEPDGNRNQNLWQAIPNAYGISMVVDATINVMVTAESDGTLGIWTACIVQGAGNAQPALIVPYFDPAIYCVVAFIEIDNTTNAATNIYGAAGTGAGYITYATDGTFLQVIGPVLPHPTNMPVN
jgi:hypothetical protein